MNKDSCRQLFEKIFFLLGKGVTADDAVYSYIASTFFNPSIREVERIIADRSNLERDSLVDLFLFPDAAFQLKLEPLLSQFCFSRSEERWLADLLSKEKITVVIYLPGLNGHIRLNPTPSELSRLISRLNITWRATKPVRRAIENHIATSRQDLVHLCLRNADLVIDASRRDFLCHFLTVFDDAQAEFFEYFDFVIDFLGRVTEDDPYPALIEEKRRLTAGLRQAIKVEQQMLRNNMETLMLQGVRAPADSSAYFRKNITIVDMISRSLLGQSVSMETIDPAAFLEPFEDNLL